MSIPAGGWCNSIERLMVKARRACQDAAWLMLLAACAGSAAATPQPNFRDPLEVPAEKVAADAKRPLTARPLMAVAHAGSRLVAVGSRGLIIVSDNDGRTWTQAAVPVQTDLLGIHFPTPKDGWAVGHNGVILHSQDGGLSWEKQTDGRSSEPEFNAFYERLGDEGQSAAKQLALNYRAGPALPFLDVWFEDERNGYAVGSFGMIVATTDAGQHWEPWLHRVDNPDFLNLNAIRGIGKDIYIAGERGQVYRLDRAAGKFARMDTGYAGSLFGVAGTPAEVVAFGLRGTAFRLAGKRWEPVALPTEQTITAGVVCDGRFILANSAGQLFVTGKADGKPLDFREAPVAERARITGIETLADKRVVSVGLDGVLIQALPGAPASQDRRK